jgi:hypothetical protein
MREAEPDKSVVAAAIWLADLREHVPQIIPMLRDRFAITATQAAQACTLANQMRIVRRAHG